MKRTNWSTANFYGVVKPDELDPKDLRWLCGCGRSKSFRHPRPPAARLRKKGLMTVSTYPPSMAAELEAARIGSERRNPACPGCGRRYAVRSFKAHSQKPTFFCDPSRSIGGCGREWPK